MQNHNFVGYIFFGGILNFGGHVGFWKMSMILKWYTVYYFFVFCRPYWIYANWIYEMQKLLPRGSKFHSFLASVFKIWQFNVPPCIVSGIFLTSDPAILTCYWSYRLEKSSIPFYSMIIAVMSGEIGSKLNEK